MPPLLVLLCALCPLLAWLGTFPPHHFLALETLSYEIRNTDLGLQSIRVKTFLIYVKTEMLNVYQTMLGFKGCVKQVRLAQGPGN